jgi:hypothetical protein
MLFGIACLYAGAASADNTPCKLMDKECFTESGYPACKDKRAIQKYYEFVEAGSDALAQSIVEGDKGCIKLAGNEKVYMMDKSGDYVKFSFRGREGQYWAKGEAIYAK